MASASIAQTGNCLLDLGRLGEAATAYEEAIRRSKALGRERDVAMVQFQLGTVRLFQRLFPEALATYAEARKQLIELDEPATVAALWHQTGMAYQEAKQPEAAEQAYGKSLAIAVQLKNVAGQASTLCQLGILYDIVLGRPKEAIAFYCQAAVHYVALNDSAGEGTTRSNLALALCKLRRLDEARQEIHRAIECKRPFGHAAAPWTTWAILADIEIGAGNTVDAVQARGQARAAYLAYRRDGGENQYTNGRIANDLRQRLLAGEQSGAAEFVVELVAPPDPPPWAIPFVTALQAIVAGSRDPALADAPEFSYDTAAEILLLIETLNNASGPSVQMQQP